MKRTLGAVLLLLGGACQVPCHVVDIDGRPVDAVSPMPGLVHVVVFTSHECPIANAYAPRLRELAATEMGRSVRWFFVHVDPDLTPAAARQHATDYGLPGTIVLDPTHRLARDLGVTRTPEAAVVTAEGVAYRGRIDDEWVALGQRSGTVTQHDLRDAIAAAIDGRIAARRFVPAVGCLLPEPARP